MKLIKFNHRYDYGHDWYVQILNTGKHVPNPFKCWSLIQASVSWNDYPSGPYIQIKSGSGTLFSAMFWCYKFGFDIGFVERTWDWNYMENVDDESED
jgi:hypothetical protein